jgi:hypothetical protein
VVLGVAVEVVVSAEVVVATGFEVDEGLDGLAFSEFFPGSTIRAVMAIAAIAAMSATVTIVRLPTFTAGTVTLRKSMRAGSSQTRAESPSSANTPHVDTCGVNLPDRIVEA